MNTSPPQRFWDGVVRRLGAEMPPFALEAWIGPLVARSGAREGSESSERLTLGCPTAFHRDRVRVRFLPEIERCAALEAGAPIAVDLVIAPPLRCSVPKDAHPTERCAAPPFIAASASAPAAPARARAAEPDAAPDPQRALPYRFDNFVVGSCNALAREASLAVARSAQRALNPLVLAAPPGNGKTHLARAILTEARQHGEARAIYASAEAFTNDFTHSLQARRIDEFKRRFRHGCRLLVLEDVQFLDARKKATQLELFHTLCHLLDVGARVVLTADRLPRDIEGLDPRLGSKLSSGLVAELEAPDAIVRREILRQKAADGGVRLPDACRELIVESVRGSVRDLEGVLIQLVAMASLLKRPIDPQLTLVALRKLAPISAFRHRLAIRDVVEAVAAYFKQRPDELAARSRRRDVLVPRQLAMYLGHRYTGATLSEIGTALGRNHSAAANAVRVVERRILECAPLRYQVEALCARLDGMVGGRK
ncbi:MAG: chromosomal replication initiator protein DnaA [Deltaproteobacteria bacterium]|nr:MAG: chromosomal replication initiator protein DnaA [Deltaproteobacteria bacterium]